jgi:hypothetical protein
MPEAELAEKLKELGFEYKPDLPGDPDFAHFGFKLALTITSRDAYRELEEKERIKFNLSFKQRFSALMAKHWHCQRIHTEDSLEETIEGVKHIIIQKETARIRLPEGPAPIYKKLIALLKGTDEALLVEERRMKRNYPLLWGLNDRRKSIEQRLHIVLKPVILKRDNYRCRACGSTEKLELARTSGGDMAKPERLSTKRTIWVYPDAEKRWAIENMFILCQKCHKYFDSFRSRAWRYNAEPISTEQWVELIRSGKLKEMPPLLREHFEKLKLTFTLGSFRTFFKVLRKAIIFYRKGDLKKYRLFLGHVKKNWRYLSRNTVLTEEVKGRIDILLQEIYRLKSVAEMEKAEQNIRENLFVYFQGSIPSEAISKFKETLTKQDIVLSKLERNP